MLTSPSAISVSTTADLATPVPRHEVRAADRPLGTLLAADLDAPLGSPNQHKLGPARRSTKPVRNSSFLAREP